MDGCPMFANPKGHPSVSSASLLLDDNVRGCGIPHLAKNERDSPNFLHAALDKTACAPFIKERRMNSAEPTKPHRKSGVWGTRRSVASTEMEVSYGELRLRKTTFGSVRQASFNAMS